MPCVDFAEAKGGVLHCHWDSHHYRTRTEIASAVMKISLLMPISNAASERTFSKEQDWQGTLFGVGPGHYGCHSVCTKIKRWVTRSFAQPRLLSECPKLVKNNNLLHSTTNAALV